MRYLSIDLESTGLDADCQIIEFSMVPFCTQSKHIALDLSYTSLVKCDDFEKLLPKLNPWVIENMSPLIKKSHQKGIEISMLKAQVEHYLLSKPVRDFFGEDKIVIFGKSLNAIDLPFLNRDFGWEFMRQYFSHRVLDLSSVGHALADMGLLPKGSESGSKLMAYLGMGDVAHNALDDAVNTAKMYLQLIEKFSKNSGTTCC